MQFGFTARNIPLIAALLVVGFPVPTTAASAVIDQELNGQIDFRNEVFRECLGKTQCEVNGVKIRAERRSDDGTAWFSTNIYWDMIDGLGIEDGAQNDEIDFDERLFVTFPEPQQVSKVWLSDLFHTEDPRYGSADSDTVQGVDVDTESAVIQLSLAGQTLDTVLLEADDILPQEPFNQEISLDFQEDGDLRRRIVIVGDSVRIVAPGSDGSANINFDGITIGQIDPEKKSIFEGVETVEVDLTDILAEFNEAELFLVGTHNFEKVQSLTNDPEALANMRQSAEAQRQTLDLSNGEISWLFETPTEADTVIFSAPFDASNDFSVAGIVTE